MQKWTFSDISEHLWPCKLEHTVCNKTARLNWAAGNQSTPLPHDEHPAHRAEVSHPCTSSIAVSISVSLWDVTHLSIGRLNSLLLQTETQAIKPNPYLQNGIQPICPLLKKDLGCCRKHTPSVPRLKLLFWAWEIAKRRASSMLLKACSSIIPVKQAAAWLHTACYPQLHVQCHCPGKHRIASQERRLHSLTKLHWR